MASGDGLDVMPHSELDTLGVVAKRARRPVFAGKLAGIPPDFATYRRKTLRDLTAPDDTDEIN